MCEAWEGVDAVQGAEGSFPSSCPLSQGAPAKLAAQSVEGGLAARASPWSSWGTQNHGLFSVLLS